MAYYSVSYDLNVKGKDYSGLTSALERMGAHRILLSMWVLSSQRNIKDIYNTLKPYIDENDRLLVTVINGMTTESHNLMKPNDGRFAWLF